MSSDEGYIERNRGRYRVVRGGERSYICECFTQQGTWHKTSFAFCQNTVKHGYFDPAIADRGSGQDGMPVDRQPPPLEQPPEGQQQAQQGSRFTHVTYEKGRFLW